MAFAREAIQHDDGKSYLTVTVEFQLTMWDLAQFLARWNRWSEDYQPELAVRQAEKIIDEELWARGDQEWYGNEYYGEDEWKKRETWALDQVKHCFGARF